MAVVCTGFAAILLLPARQLLGAYSNSHRGVAARREGFEVEPAAAIASAEPPESESAWLKERKKSWAQLIRRVYEADPLLCRCGQRMRFVGFITQSPVIRKTWTTSAVASTCWRFPAVRAEFGGPAGLEAIILTASRPGKRFRVAGYPQNRGRLRVWSRGGRFGLKKTAGRGESPPRPRRVKKDFPI